MDIAAELARKWWVLVLFGVVSVLFGLMALFSPMGTVMAMTWAIGVMAIAEGVISVLALFGKEHATPKWLMALYALASLAFGVLAVLNPVAIAAVLLVFLAAWLLVAGVLRWVPLSTVAQWRWILGFNVLGVGLLVAVIRIALLSLPWTLRSYMNDPRVELVFHAPHTWILPVCVAGALWGHVLVFRWLWANRAGASGV